MTTPLTLRERIILVFTNEVRNQSNLFKGHFSTHMTTRMIRKRMGNAHSCAEIRKELVELEKDGYVHKHDFYSNRNSTVWRWDK